MVNKKYLYLLINNNILLFNPFVVRAVYLLRTYLKDI